MLGAVLLTTHGTPEASHRGRGLRGSPSLYDRDAVVPAARVRAAAVPGSPASRGFVCLRLGEGLAQLHGTTSLCRPRSLPAPTPAGMCAARATGNVATCVRVSGGAGAAPVFCRAVRRGGGGNLPESTQMVRHLLVL